jgi:D-sedoheptulose 7-phosphate isomerase
MTKYLKRINECFSKIEVKDREQKRIPLEKTISRIVALAVAAAKKRNKVVIIGNGGSAAIASHTAIDLLKNARVPALAFNDPSFLTCLTNDLGYDAVFAKPIEMLSQKGDVLIAISSSGKSSNILNGVKAARDNKNFVITLSGFSNANPLRKMGDINFFVPSSSYGFVEITHSVICHWIIDEILQQRAHG